MQTISNVPTLPLSDAQLMAALTQHKKSTRRRRSVIRGDIVKGAE